MGEIDITRCPTCGSVLRDARTQSMRTAIRALLDKGVVSTPTNRSGAQSALARHYGVTRQRVNQVWRKVEEEGA